MKHVETRSACDVCMDVLAPDPLFASILMVEWSSTGWGEKCCEWRTCGEESYVPQPEGTAIEVKTNELSSTKALVFYHSNPIAEWLKHRVGSERAINFCGKRRPAGEMRDWEDYMDVWDVASAHQEISNVD